MNELKDYEKNFLNGMEEAKSGECDILGNLVTSFTNEFVDSVLGQFIAMFNNNGVNSEILESNTALSIKKQMIELNDDMNNLIDDSIKKSIEILRKYNIDGYYTMYYRGYQKDFIMHIDDKGNYYIYDENHIMINVGFDAYSLSRIRFKSTPSNVMTVYYYLKNKQRRLNKPKVKRINNQLF